MILMSFYVRTDPRPNFLENIFIVVDLNKIIIYIDRVTGDYPSH